MIYPVAEIFDSIQGEGAHAGRAMRFLRLAGCTVGRQYTAAERMTEGLHIFQERCTSWSGVSFACDTDYRVAERISLEDLLERMTGMEHISITGGEPLMHPVNPLIYELLKKSHTVHVETSGTIVLGDWVRNEKCWVTISPKAKYLATELWKAQAVKVLIGSDFDEAVFMHRFGSFLDKLWVQPINGLDALDRDNTKICADLVMRNPQIRMSTQLHKIWNCR